MSDYTMWFERLKYWEDRLNEENLDKDSKYIMTSAHKLIRMAIESDQLFVPTEGYIECSRVVRMRRLIPNYVFNATHTEKVLLSGLFIKIDGILFSKNYVDDYILGNKSGLSNSLSDVFPDYKFSTIRIEPNGSAFVVKKGGLSDWIEYGHHYQLLNLESEKL